jgi:(E)-4-hydroxy-3-methylbut-2-enyl-diphosphate synthase
LQEWVKALRRKSRRVRIGKIAIGGGEPIAVQSMTKTDTRDAKATIEAIHALEEAGCEIVRVAVPDKRAADALREIKQNTSIPLVADIHFDHRLALEALEAGVDKLRINPGNIGDRAQIETVVKAAREREVPMRIGVNVGSLEKDLLEKHGHPTAEAIVESALRHARILEDLDFHDIVISVKASDAPTTITAYRALVKAVDYPLHLGVTEAGTAFSGTIKSAVALGVLLSEGVGDTVRISLSDESREEVRVGFEILKSLGLREHGPTVVSCPTCGRVEIDLIKTALEVEKRIAKVGRPIRISVMGCVVNGPGEAQEADYGIAGGKGIGLIYRKGQMVRRVKEEEMVEALLEEIRKGEGIEV